MAQFKEGSAYDFMRGVLWCLGDIFVWFSLQKHTLCLNKKHMFLVLIWIALMFWDWQALANHVYPDQTL